MDKEIKKLKDKIKRLDKVYGKGFFNESVETQKKEAWMNLAIKQDKFISDYNKLQVENLRLKTTQLSELMKEISVGDDIVFDNKFGVFKIIKLEEVKEDE